jgi:hypothetical protein
MQKNPTPRPNKKPYTSPRLEKVTLAANESVLQISKCKTTGMAGGPGGFGCMAAGMPCNYVN